MRPCKGKTCIEVTDRGLRGAVVAARRACMILVFWAQAACLAAERNSWFLDDARSERAYSSVNALFCMCVLLRSCKPGQKGMGVCCPF